MKTSEHDHQVALMTWATLNEWRYPGLELLYAVPNGGKRHLGVARKLKAEGVRSGVPDLCLPVARDGKHGLYIELKSENGHMTKQQGEWMQRLTAEGYRAVLCYGWDSARAEIENYLMGE